jgi:glycosyltransferase involved in cell wall biosynthesis
MRETQQEIVYIGYTGGLGGEAMQMFELAAGTAERGWKVTVVVPELPALQRFAVAYRTRPNLTVVQTPHIVFDTGMQRPADVLHHLRPYANAPLLHLHTGDICIPRMTMLMLEGLRPKRCFATIHAASPEMAFGSLRARYWASASRRLLRYVFCPSDQGRQTQIDYGVPAERAITIRNGVDVAHYASGNGDIARRSLNLAPEVPLVVATSRLHPQKRPWDTLSAFAESLRDLPGIVAPHLVFVGTGPLEEELKEQAKKQGIAERVHFVGLQTNIPDWLAAATVWIFPSEAENSPLSLFEALSAGCPIVATHCAGNNEILQDGVNSLTTDVGDVMALSVGICRLLTDADLRIRLSDAARRSAGHFSRDTMVEKHITYYCRSLEQKT